MLKFANILRKKQGLLLAKYKSCSDLPMYYFIKAVCTGDISRIENWEEIYSEYALLSKDTHQLHLLAVLKDISVLTNKIILIEAIVQQLAIRYNDELATILASNGFPIKQSEHYERDLRMIITRAKAMLIRKNDRLKELEGIQSKKGDAVKESDYDAVMVELSKFMGYRLDTHIVTVSEYCAIMNKYKASLKNAK